MNIYLILLLIGLIANISLGTYIIGLNPGSWLNRLYALVSMSLIIWTVGDIIFLLASSSTIAMLGDKVSTTGAFITCLFLLNFFIVFTKVRASFPKIFVFLYPLIILFISLELTTNLFVSSVSLTPNGYTILPGILYGLDIAVIALYIIIGLVLSFRFYTRLSSHKERYQALLLIIAVSIPLAFGLITELLPVVIEKNLVPQTSMMTTITAIIVAYTIAKYNLMAITPAMAVNNIIKTMADYLVVIDTNKTVVLVDDSLQEALGKDKTELVGKNLDDLPLSLEGLFERLEAAEFVNNFDAEMQDKDSSTIPISVNVSTMRDKKNEPIGYVLVMRNIKDTKTLIKSLEEDKKTIESSNKELEQMNKLMVGRELKMIELKNEIKELKKVN
ncbi:MAG: PAS domain-containing protein [Prolixibacteraceae bacterium]|nr:PAS domain-containing protein [Prolixibacteraceae bacterium]